MEALINRNRLGYKNQDCRSRQLYMNTNYKGGIDGLAKDCSNSSVSKQRSYCSFVLTIDLTFMVVIHVPIPGLSFQDTHYKNFSTRLQ